MEYHSIQFTTISINVERGVVKILFKYRYFQDLLIDIDIDIDISQILLSDIDIDIFQNHHIDIDIDIFGIALSISIFSKMTIFQRCRYIDNRYVISIYIEQGYVHPSVQLHLNSSHSHHLLILQAVDAHDVLLAGFVLFCFG